jgi:hypothetical protein
MILFISPKYGSRSDSVRLIEAARRSGIKTETLLNSWENVSKTISRGEDAALYGEHAFCEFIAQEMQWNLYQNSLDWVAKLPLTFIKRSIKCVTLEEVIEMENSGRCILDKRVLEPADDPCFQKGIHQTRFPRVPLDTPILVSLDQEWTTKFRFVVVNNKIVTSCCYRMCGIYNIPTIWKTHCELDGMTPERFMHTLLDTVNVAPGCVIDVGYLKNAGWAVSGTKPIWAAELYGCEPRPFLDALFAACQRM